MCVCVWGGGVSSRDQHVVSEQLHHSHQVQQGDGHVGAVVVQERGYHVLD